jgi:tetratricopeptide (TPR) repeat protein
MRCLWAILASTAAMGLAWGQSPAGVTATAQSVSTGTATRPTTAPAGVAALIDLIRTTDDARTAMAAYARANAIAPGSADLHHEYVRRMLKFGLPKIAYFAARNLVPVDPADGLGWGVIGYMHGTRGEMTEALTATFRALENRRDDVAILHNAGQLLAWHESQFDPPALSDRTRRAIDTLRDTLNHQDEFAKAYTRVREWYKDSAAATADLEKKSVSLADDIAALQQAAAKIDRQLRDTNDEIDYHNNLLDSLRDELRSYSYTVIIDIATGVRTVVPTPVPLSLRQDLMDRIIQEERTLDGLRVLTGRLRNDMQNDLDQLLAKRADLEGLKKQLLLAGARVERRFRWDPPAIDGVITPEADHVPTTTNPSPLPADPQRDAAARLELAKLYLQNNMAARGTEILRDLLVRYPSTTAAEEAKKLLPDVKPGK